MKTEINNTTAYKIDQGQIRDLVAFFADKYQVPDRELSIAYIGDEEMSALNKHYRQKDGPTDILSFDGDEEMFGELLLDLDQIKRQEHFYSEDIEEEAMFIIIHGLLHLVGYNDDKEEDRLKMINIGKEILDSFLKKQT